MVSSRPVGHGFSFLPLVSATSSRVRVLGSIPKEFSTTEAESFCLVRFGITLCRSVPSGAEGGIWVERAV
jgi:hypothetical protein